MIRYRRYRDDDPKIYVIDTDDTLYRGHLKKSLKHGFGVYVNEKGTYTGEWYKDQRHGDGVMEYADGTLFMGEWHHDIEFKGILEHRDGSQTKINPME
jgi:hypothetical protein